MSIALILGLVLGVQIPAPTADEELRNHIDRLSREVEDPSRPLERRVSVLLDIASALDRAAQEEKAPDRALARWDEAISRLDEFTRRNDDLDKEPLLPVRLQSGIYVWAEGRNWSERASDAMNDPAMVAKARGRFDEARDRFAKILPEAKDNPVISQNARFRMAQAIADAASLEQTGDADAARKSNEQALQILNEPIDEPGLSGFAGLLRAELLQRLGRHQEASKALDLMAERTPSPPEVDRLPIVVEILNSLVLFDEALKRVDASTLKEEEKASLKVKVRLAQRGRLSPGAERDRIEVQAIAEAEPLRGKDTKASRLALVELARVIGQPGAESDPSAFELLAEGHRLAGRTERAAELLRRGADRASALGKVDQAAELRIRAGAILFREGRYRAAEGAFESVIDDPKAGQLRPKASLLRAIARDRGSALQPPTSTKAAYRQALESHLDLFGSDASSAEVRWLLGTEYRQSGRPSDAAKLWEAIPVGHPRWVDSRLSLADEKEQELRQLLPINEPTQVQPKALELRESLQSSLLKAPDAVAATEFKLRLARLDLLPIVGKPEEARQAMEDLLRQPSSVEQQALARLYLIVALTGSGRVADAEARARAEAKVARPEDALAAIRMLDAVATDTDSDLSRIRAVAIIKLLIAPIMARLNEVPEGLRQEFRLRQARAFALGGDYAAGRSILANSPIDPSGVDDAFLRDLADVYSRTEAHSIAIDVQRMRTRRLVAGTPGWFDARYGLALACYRARRLDDARQIIDATSILHPNLGGGDLKIRFERLRRRLSEE